MSDLMKPKLTLSRKATEVNENDFTAVKNDLSNTTQSETQPVKRGRGRPRKNDPVEKISPPKRPRGRPRKNSTITENPTDISQSTEPKRPRGRPRKKVPELEPEIEPTNSEEMTATRLRPTRPRPRRSVERPALPPGPPTLDSDSESDSEESPYVQPGQTNNQLPKQFAETVAKAFSDKFGGPVNGNVKTTMTINGVPVDSSQPDTESISPVNSPDGTPIRSLGRRPRGRPLGRPGNPGFANNFEPKFRTEVVAPGEPTPILDEIQEKYPDYTRNPDGSLNIPNGRVYEGPSGPVWVIEEENKIDKNIDHIIYRKTSRPTDPDHPEAGTTTDTHIEIFMKPPDDYFPQNQVVPGSSRSERQANLTKNSWTEFLDEYMKEIGIGTDDGWNSGSFMILMELMQHRFMNIFQIQNWYHKHRELKDREEFFDKHGMSWLWALFLEIGYRDMDIISRWLDEELRPEIMRFRDAREKIWAREAANPDIKKLEDMTDCQKAKTIMTEAVKLVEAEKNQIRQMIESGEITKEMILELMAQHEAAEAERSKN